jgi:energy-coupling factor transporter ATP-binding protein EcfA2
MEEMMKIRGIQLTNFKRFTDTTIADIPVEARLVLLVGPNGCGKSSLIDAAQMWYRNHWAGSRTWDETYHRKQMPGIAGNWPELVTLTFHDPQPATEEQRKKAVYVRSPYRNDPEFQLDNLSRVGPAIQEFRINRLIDNDQAVSLNYRRLVSQGFEDIYERAQPDLTIGEFRERSIGEIRDAMRRLFPGLVLNSLGNPLSAGTFRFDKGDSKAFLYKNLSGGEKAAFDLLLDILIKKSEFDDTVFFIDEPEAHMSPGLQSVLLDELFRAIPANSQLWLATHSIGMMRRARDLAQGNPGTVVFLDFDGVNFDLPVILQPIEPSRPFWKRAMQIALDDLAGYVTPEQVVLCEGGRLQGGADFDADCYNEIFKVEYPHVVFLGACNSDDVLNDPRGVGRLLTALAPGIHVTRIIDRDDRTDDEIRALQAQQVRVLSQRTIESYLLEDSVLQAMCEAFGQPELTPQILEAKADALRNSIANGGPADDLKRPAGDIYNSAKRLFPARKLGSDKRAFMKGLCAPLVHGTPVYEVLRQDIFDE